jgi:hypothetical protein
VGKQAPPARAAPSLVMPYLDSGLAGGSQWTYFIVAQNAVGSSSPSAGASATVGSATDDDSAVIEDVASGTSHATTIPSGQYKTQVIWRSATSSALVDGSA